MSTLEPKYIIMVAAVCGLLIGGGVGYTVPQTEISSLESSLVEKETQISDLNEINNDLNEIIDDLEHSIHELNETYKDLVQSHNDIVSDYASIDHTLTDLQTEYEEYQEYYQSMWDKYNELIQKYNNLTLISPVGEMVVTEVSGIVNGDFENGNEGWLLQGKGGIGWGAAYLHRLESYSTYLTQTVEVNSKWYGFKFDVKPQPVGGSVGLRVSIDDVIVYDEIYSGVNSEFDFTTIVIPMKPLFEMRELYNLPTDRYYSLKFTVPVGPESGAIIVIDDVSLVYLEYQPEEPSISNNNYEYIQNGGFEEPVQHDPWKIPEWDGGGTIGVSQGYVGKAVYLYQWSYKHNSEIFQTVILDTSPMTLSFWIRPYPQGYQVRFQLLFDGYILYNETYMGSNNDYDWEKIRIQLDPEIGMHEIRFSVLTGPVYYPEQSYLGIDEVSLTP